MKSTFPEEVVPEPKETIPFVRKESMNGNGLTSQPLKRENSPPLTTSKTTAKLKQTKPIETSPNSKKPVEAKPIPTSASKQPTLTKTKTVANLKTTTTTTTNPQKQISKEDPTKSKLSLKIDTTKEEPIITPKTTKASGVPTLTENPKPLSRIPTSKGPLSNTVKVEPSKLGEPRKTLVKNQTSKGPLVKPQLEEKKTEDKNAKSNFNNLSRKYSNKF